MKRFVAVNEFGRIIGEGHKDAKLTDADVDMIREFHEAEGWGYRRLAKTFDVCKSTIRKIVKYETRAQTPDRFKTVVG
ncbi:hypothetical protein [Asticcacaulis sp. AC402]|uniref:hypothetical protein n=1 Tax=Asticcacaulis sp. AC402 TaxID=1282361 RepID=UPI0003C3AE52|nr:hypothetical protein [Asticcacaulis sp. AC402]ESQ73720.1 hypothetical protein ABAC402_17800 [Asticcacaulis sp. AC402]